VSDAPSCAVQLIVDGHETPRRDVAGPRFCIGSAPDCEVVVPHASVAGHHLGVELSTDGCRVADLGAPSGTFVGHVRLGELTITAPLTLRLGDVTVHLAPAAEGDHAPRPRAATFGALVSQAPAMQELFHELGRIAPTDCNVLIEGETGVGKELIAETLHRQSSRSAGPFVVVDCAALVGDLMEAELFGHARGAFTGATVERAGLIELASGGTLFLDEVGELPLELQAKLLGVLERRRVTPIGGSGARPVDIRVVAATNRNLARETGRGRFRAHLYYRLAVIELHVPPLRERTEDIPLLVAGFLEELRARDAAAPATLSEMELARLAAEPWPGNVRDLRNEIERLAGASAAARAELESFQRARGRVLEEFERHYFDTLLEECDGKLARVAAASGLDRSYLSRILRRLYGPTRSHGWQRT
jgi:DNA-binding NtrC family response regulator